jgi:hypothetical protein
MQSKSKCYVETHKGIFVDYKKSDYFQKITAKINSLYLSDSSQLTPLILELSPYKIHVSLVREEYIEHKDKIQEILISSLEKGIINAFKLVDIELLTAKLISMSNALNFISEYKKILGKKKITNSSWQTQFLETIGYWFNTNFQMLPNKNELNEIDSVLTTAFKSAQRFSNSDQFTIYIADNFDKKKILNLCREIDNFLKENDANAAKLLDVESPLGKYMNFRQEYLMADFNLFNNLGFLSISNRIDASQINDDESENIRRKQVLIEQEESELYQYLNNKMKQSSLSDCSIFKDDTKKNHVSIEKHASMTL